MNCHVTLEQRREFQIQLANWNDDGPARRMEEVVLPLVSDWGTGLSRSLYLEAVVALLGGEEQCRHFAATTWQGYPTGRQPVHLIEQFVALEITCKKEELDVYESHLRRFWQTPTLRVFCG